MGFFDVLDKAPTYEKRSKSVTDYIRLDYDKPVKVQLLIPEGSKLIEVYTHWVQGRKLPVRCLGAGACPVCSRNEKIDYDKTNADFIGRDRKFIVNALDLTMMKTCPNCSTVNERNATKCSGEECGKGLIDVEAAPLKMVRYLEGPKALFEQIRQDMAMYLSEQLQYSKEYIEENLNKHLGETPISIKRYKKGENEPPGYTTFPLVNDKDTVNVKEYSDQLFDLEKTGIHVSYDEMVVLMNGGSYKDILSNRPKKNDKQKELDDIFGDS
jgi:hypothetical protein